MKRTLSVILAVIMMLSMLIISANAVEDNAWTTLPPREKPTSAEGLPEVFADGMWRGAEVYHGGNAYYRFTPKQSGKIIILSSGPMETFRMIYDDNMTLLKQSSDLTDRDLIIIDSIPGMLFGVEAGKTYVIELGMYEVTGKMNFRIEFIEQSTDTTEPTTDAVQPFQWYKISELKDGYGLWYFHQLPPPWMEVFGVQYGKYIFTNYNSKHESGHGFFVKKDDERLLLSEAFERGITDIDEVVHLIWSDKNLYSIPVTIIDTEKADTNWKENFFPGYHYNPEETYPKETTEEKFLEWTKKTHGKNSLSDGYRYTELYHHKDSDGNIDWVLVDACYLLPVPALEVSMTIGGRYILSGAIYTPFKCCYGIYDVNEDTFYDMYDFQDNPERFSGLVDALTELNIGTVVEEPTEPSETVEPTTEPEVKAKKANKMKVTVKDKKVKAKKLRRAKVTVKAITVKNNNGKVTFSKIAKKSSNRLSVNAKTGKITIKKGTKKGNYKIRVKVYAKGTKNYKPKTITKTVKIKVIK